LLALPELPWQDCPEAGEWCLTEVVCHLRDVELEVHQPRFYALIAEEGAFLPGAVSDEWVEERRYREQEGPVALVQFLDARRATLAVLGTLDEAMWQRQGQHAFFGPTTMHELLHLAVQHDQAHHAQILDLLDENTSGATTTP
jgi:hypothetical protein